MAWNWKKQASAAYGYALVHLALNYCIYMDNQQGKPLSHDSGEEYSEEEERVLTQVEKQLYQTMERFLRGQDNLAELDVLRRQLSDEMIVIMAYTDCFCIYDHALNRMERRFDTTLAPLTKTDDECTERLFNFVMSAENLAVMNRRIQLVMEQLPIRFTRQKFFAMVKEALLAYIGSDQSSLTQVMYLLRSSAMVEITEEQAGRYPQLKEMSDQLKTVFSQLKTMDVGKYKEARDIIDLATKKLFVYAEFYQMVEELVNDLCILALTRQGAVINSAEESAAMEILRKLQENPAVVLESTENLYQLEGVQEQYFEKYQHLDQPPEATDMELPAARHARVVDRLLSSSPFAELAEEPSKPAVTRSDVELAAGKFFEQLETVFTGSPKSVVWAVMAITLANLPVCFNSRDELRDYIKNSLASCTDSAEKETCMELLEQVMEMEDDALL